MMGGELESLLDQGYQARKEQRLAEALQRFAEAVDLSRKSDDRALLAQSLTGKGQIERDLGDLEGALKCYEEAVDLYRVLNRPLVLAHTIRHVGDILRNQTQLGMAAPHYEEALAIYRGLDDAPPLDLANAIRGYALLRSSVGEKAEAAKLWQEAGALYAAVGVQAGVAESEAQVARLTA